jgi:hypothetical protein
VHKNSDKSSQEQNQQDGFDAKKFKEAFFKSRRAAKPSYEVEWTTTKRTGSSSNPPQPSNKIIAMKPTKRRRH